MNWYSVFYWLTVSDGVKKFFDTTSDIFTWFAVISFIVFIILVIVKALLIADNKLKTKEEELENPDVRGIGMAKNVLARFLYVMIALSLITWFGYMATPTKKDCLMIIAGGAVGNFITSDSSARQLPADITKYLHLSLQEEIKTLGDDTRREFGVYTPKEKFMNKVKNMTKDELIEFIQNDTTLINK